MSTDQTKKINLNSKIMTQTCQRIHGDMSQSLKKGPFQK